MDDLIERLSAALTPQELEALASMLFDGDRFNTIMADGNTCIRVRRAVQQAHRGRHSLLRDAVTPPPRDPTKPLTVNKPRADRVHPEDFGQ